MKTKTIRQLNKINSDFYNSIAQEFSQSRNYPWEGWKRCLPFIQDISEKQPLTVADIGCGNGRFGLFLTKNIYRSFSYTGIDNNSELLDITKKDLNDVTNNNILHLDTHNIDLIESLIDNTFTKKLNQEKYSLITVFGVMHHIPSLDLRVKFIQKLSTLLTKNGIIILTFWQFMKDERFAYKQVSPEKLNINPNDLEKGDHILDWKRGKLAYRYFHFSDEEEQTQITSKIPSLTVVDSFLSDGKSQILNKYIILGKS